MRTSACQRNDGLVRSMALDGHNLTEIGKAIGTTRHRVMEYIRKNDIPHLPFLKTHSREKNGRWNGGRIIDKDGYALVKMRDHPNCDRHGYVREHRLVMEQCLDRYLLPCEVVHHKDDDKLNNSIDNLEIYSNNAAHLAKTLAGKIPNWTPDGVRRIQLGIRRKRQPRGTIPVLSTPHDPE